MNKQVFKVVQLNGFIYRKAKNCPKRETSACQSWHMYEAPSQDNDWNVGWICVEDWDFGLELDKAWGEECAEENCNREVEEGEDKCHYHY